MRSCRSRRRGISYLKVAASASRSGIGQYLGKGADELKRNLEEAAQGKLAVPGKDAAKGAGDALKKMLGK